MSLIDLVLKEIAHRKLSFTIGFAAIVLASGIVSSQLIALDIHDSETVRILKSREEVLEKEMWLMEDDYRKIMLQLGFNVLIFSADQRVDQYWADGELSHYMPEEYVHKLAADSNMIIRHLLPIVQEKIIWPEKNRTIILIGTRGVVAGEDDPREPLLAMVPPGEIVLGYEIWRGLDLEVGDTVTLLGRDFTVGVCHPQRGSKDDISVWIDLSTSQAMLDKAGRINAILALKCLCPMPGINSIKDNITRILPGTQVIEFEDKAITRELARKRAKAVSDSMFFAEVALRADMGMQKEKFASFLIPIMIISGTALIFLLTFSNVRSRREEIGILLAIGVDNRKIMEVFLAKAGFLGLAGSLTGFFFGALLLAGASTADYLFSMRMLIMFVSVVAGSVAFTLLASWIPAMAASMQDPAAILRGE